MRRQVGVRHVRRGEEKILDKEGGKGRADRKGRREDRKGRKSMGKFSIAQLTLIGRLKAS